MKRFLLIPLIALLSALGSPGADAQRQGGHPNDCTYSDAIIGHCVQVVLVDSLSSAQKAVAYDAIYRGAFQARCSGTGPVVYCVLGVPVGDTVAVGSSGATCRVVRDAAGVVAHYECSASTAPDPDPDPAIPVTPVPVAPSTPASPITAPAPSFTG